MNPLYGWHVVVAGWSKKKRGGGESGTLIDQSERAREKNSSI